LKKEINAANLPKPVKEVEEEQAKIKKIHGFEFKPAALQKNEPFQSNNQLYGEEGKKIGDLLDKAIEERHKGREKYKTVLAKGAKKHDFAFKPNHLGKSGSDDLFSEIYGIPFIGHEKVKIDLKERAASKEKDKFSKPFTYNKLHENSVFSPAVSSFTCNLKKEFPSVFNKY